MRATSSAPGARTCARARACSNAGVCWAPPSWVSSRRSAAPRCVCSAGREPVSLGVAPDRLDEIEARLRWGLDCDLLISSAGVSVGEHDFVKAALERLGAEQHLWLVDMRPGKPV